MWGIRDPPSKVRQVHKPGEVKHRKRHPADGRPLKQELFITVSRALASLQNSWPEDTEMQ